MRWFVPCSFMLALVAAPAAARTTVSVTVSNAPPAPAVAWHREPKLVPMRTIDVWYYDGACDYDYFRYGSYYYIYQGNYWYRALSFRGPFVSVREEFVPRVFYGLHERGYRWHHPWKTVAPARTKHVERTRAVEHSHGSSHGHHGD